MKGYKSQILKDKLSSVRWISQSLLVHTTKLTNISFLENLEGILGIGLDDRMREFCTIIKSIKPHLEISESIIEIYGNTRLKTLGLAKLNSIEKKFTNIIQIKDNRELCLTQEEFNIILKFGSELSEFSICNSTSE